ncbi:cystathionine gamma-synthase [Meredithblackwellia eburnea MCA 4105]
MDFATLCLHADSEHSHQLREIAPSISVSTTFRYTSSDLTTSEEWDPRTPYKDVYSREGQPTLRRAETVLSAIIGADTICFSSGVAAFNSVLMVCQPDVVAVTDGYSGVRGAIKLYQQIKGEERCKVIKLDDPFPTDPKLKVLCWVETPLNPTGECRDLKYYAEKVHKVGGKLGVDSTFGPPPTQDPFKWGADYVIHSATKYLMGHSDGLIGSVSMKDKSEWIKFWETRVYNGATVGSLEAWLLLRSLRTLPIRVNRQFSSAAIIVKYLSSLINTTDTSLTGMVERVWHASLQDGGSFVGDEEGKQMTMGPACFLIQLGRKEWAELFPLKLKLFSPGASLGGVESLVEQRVLADPQADPKLVRLSIGCEGAEDLRKDLEGALRECKREI